MIRSRNPPIQRNQRNIFKIAKAENSFLYLIVSTQGQKRIQHMRKKQGFAIFKRVFYLKQHEFLSVSQKMLVIDLNYYRSAGSVFRILCSQILDFILVSHHVEHMLYSNPPLNYTNQPLKAFFVTSAFHRTELNRIGHQANWLQLKASKF